MFVLQIPVKYHVNVNISSRLEIFGGKRFTFEPVFNVFSPAAMAIF